MIYLGAAFSLSELRRPRIGGTPAETEESIEALTDRQYPAPGLASQPSPDACSPKMERRAPV
jgi:hypothetical protein